jgi:hypothetical protein
MKTKKDVRVAAKPVRRDDSGKKAPAGRRSFDEQFRKYATEQPEILKLRKILLAIGGEQLLAPARVTHDFPFLVESGFVMDYPVTEKIMRQNMCHVNSARLFAKGAATALCTGFALFGGLWVQHSWALERQKDGTNRILETTGKRDRYFGILYWGILGKFVAMRELDFNGVKPPASLKILVQRRLGLKGTGETTAIQGE